MFGLSRESSEELDAPGEWFLDRQTHILYYYPPKDLNLTASRLEGVRSEQFSKWKCAVCKLEPVRDVILQGLTFRHVARTFMLNKRAAPPQRLDHLPGWGGIRHGYRTQQSSATASSTRLAATRYSSATTIAN